MVVRLLYYVKLFFALSFGLLWGAILAAIISTPVWFFSHKAAYWVFGVLFAFWANIVRRAYQRLSERRAEDSD
jgi:Zn-dependent protease with chaperone function